MAYLADTTKVIGQRMAKEEFAEAREFINGNIKPGEPGYIKIYEARQDSTYSGRVLFNTDTHFIHQVGEKSAILHDKATLDGEFAKKPNQQLEVVYGEARGTSRIVTFAETQKANLMKAAEAFVSDMSPTVQKKTMEMLTSFIETTSPKPKQEQAQDANQNQYLEAKNGTLPKDAAQLSHEKASVAEQGMSQ